MGRASGSRSGRGTSTGSTGTNVSTGRTGNVSTGRRGGGSTNVSVGGGRDISHNTREQRRGNQPAAVAPDLIDVVNAEVDLGLEPGTISGMMAAGDVAGAAAVADAMSRRRGVGAGVVGALESVAPASALASGQVDERAREA